ncbi:PDZ domain-containing protein [Acidovorax sp. SUPP950]|uniref:S41 family peptidase n=1 Tax=Acidovorax sp. SUPP950 TaxID=511901 RepID=UPI0023C56737|nr:S41 family peptidase [Acidovorax sp. SUPP950]GKS73324.1 PDZ domain-containing protein [Acidovorax sp. SUPP950]
MRVPNAYSKQIINSRSRRNPMRYLRTLVTAGALASAWSAIAQSASPPDAADVVLATPAWIEFRNLVDKHYVELVSGPSLEGHCRQAAKQNLDVTSSPALATTVIEACLTAAAASLRYNTEYLSIANLREFDAAATQKFVGIGLEITQEDGWPKIVNPIAGSPADRDGLQRGDLIVSLEGSATRYMPLQKVVQRMRGEEGSILNLVVNRPGISESLRFAVERAPIRSRSVRSAVVAPGVGYLRIVQFRAETRAQVIEEVAKIRWSNRVAAAAVPTDQLVLDLRNCSGGLLDALTEVSALFVAPGTPVVHVESRVPGTMNTNGSIDDASAKSPPNVPLLVDWPLRRWRLVVLVNEGTAAGAESLAVLLRQRRSAMLLGQKTYGFGVIQSIKPMSAGGAVRIATGMMTVPEAPPWHSIGVQPDVEVPATAESFELGDVARDTQLHAAIAVLAAPVR